MLRLVILYFMLFFIFFYFLLFCIAFQHHLVLFRSMCYLIMLFITLLINLTCEIHSLSFMFVYSAYFIRICVNLYFSVVANVLFFSHVRTVKIFAYY